MTSRALSPGSLLRLWEQVDVRTSSHRRAVLMLAAQFPAAEWGDLAAMSVGRRERSLLELRQQHFGPLLPLYGECPACHQAVDVTLDTNELLASGGAEEEGDDDAHLHLDRAGVALTFRAPSTIDLQAAAACANVASARQLLLERSLVSATDDEGRPLDVAALDAEVVAALESEMERREPLAVVRIDLCCPACSTAWAPRLDLSEVVWSELSTEALRLVDEVSALARVYHWSEEQILAMGPRRRRMYLERGGS